MMYEGCTIYRFAGFPIYAADNRPFKTKHTREDVLFLPSYILPSYINCTSYIVPSYIFLAIFRFLFAYVKKNSNFAADFREKSGVARGKFQHGFWRGVCARKRANVRKKEEK